MQTGVSQQIAFCIYADSILHMQIVCCIYADSMLCTQIVSQVTVWNFLLAQTLTFRHDARVICDFPALRSRNVAGHARVASCSVSAITTDPFF